MLKLHGFAVSNYYNMVKLALLEKGLPFEEVLFVPNQTQQALAISPAARYRCSRPSTVFSAKPQ